MDIRPQLQLQLQRYIDKKHSQAEVNGFIDGFEIACDLVDSCDGEKEIESTSPHLPLGGVMRSASEIQKRIDDIEIDRANLLIDYAKCEDETEQGIMAQMATEKSLRIKDLKWVMGK